MHIYVHMVKVISLSDEAYKALSSIKKDKSFSELVLEMMEKLKMLKAQQNFFSSKKPKPSAETLKAWDKVKEEVQKSRKLSVRGWQS